MQKPSVYRPTRERDRCPSCDSPSPHLHPAMQFEGEVQICPHEFHAQRTNQNPPYVSPAQEPLKASIKKCRTQAEKCRTFVPSQHIGPLWGVGYIDACKSMASWLDEYAGELEAALAGSPETKNEEK